MFHRLPRVGGNVKSYMLAYDFNTTAYTRDPLDHFSLLKDMLVDVKISYGVGGITLPPTLASSEIQGGGG